MKILIIDDDDRIRELFRIWLERAGFEVHEAENGRKGVEVQQATPVDLLICDLIMPVQEGIETIKSIRLQKASNLLLTNIHSTISQIANQCGYSSQTSFLT